MNYVLQHRQISTNYGDQSFYLNLSDKCKYKLDSYNGKTGLSYSFQQCQVGLHHIYNVGE